MYKTKYLKRYITHKANYYLGFVALNFKMHINDQRPCPFRRQYFQRLCKDNRRYVNKKNIKKIKTKAVSPQGWLRWSLRFSFSLSLPFCLLEDRERNEAEGLVDKTEQPGRLSWLVGSVGWLRERAGLWSLLARDVLLFWAPLGYI